MISKLLIGSLLKEMFTKTRSCIVKAILMRCSLANTFIY